jgi:uncharacterized protein (TIGR02646 family)
MIHIQRAYPAPATLTSARAETARSELKQQVEADPSKLTIKSNIYAADDGKQVLKNMQHDKCCFCESKITHVAHGDVEHFRPKKAVLEDGQLKRPGYYWLAYTWENLMFSCELCNRREKGNRFPIDGTRAKTPEDNLEQEYPLFIDPAGPDDPEMLISFTDLGRAVAIDGNRRGQTTIRELGLNRDPLQERRQKQIQDIKIRLKLKQLATRLQDADDLAYAEQELEQYTRDQAEYASLCRAFLKRHSI